MAQKLLQATSPIRYGYICLLCLSVFHASQHYNNGVKLFTSCIHLGIDMYEVFSSYCLQKSPLAASCDKNHKPFATCYEAQNFMRRAFMIIRLAARLNKIHKESMSPYRYVK